MRTTKKVTMVAAAAALMAAATPVAGTVPTDGGRSGPSPERAHELFVQAEALLSQPKQWRRAVRLLEQSAELRGPSDPETYTCLIMAGRVRASYGDLAGARETLAKAGDQALARGAVVDAAQAYLDAAHAAAGLRRVRDAEMLRDKAVLLAESPLLSAAQRAWIMRRAEA